MDKISSVLPKVLQRRGIEKHAVSALVAHRATAWLHERHPALATAIRVSKVEEGTVVLSCAHAIAAQECQCGIVDLMAFLRLECPMAGIHDVRVTRD